VPTHWMGHGTLVIVLNGLLCTFNRGEFSGNEKGLKIYKIGNSSNVPSFLKKMLRSNELQGGDADHLLTSEQIRDKIKETKSKVFNEIEKELDLELMDIVPYKMRTNIDQMGQNCIWLVAKVAFKGGLYLREYHHNEKSEKVAVREKVKKIYSNW